jgi:crossover junction endodeoxyribonuclease RuvC
VNEQQPSSMPANNKLPAEKIILGLDPGTQVFGYGVLKQTGRDVQAIQMGVVRLEKYGAHEIRLAKIYEKVTQLIEEFLPDEMAIEAPFFGKNFQSALKLGRAQGISMAAAIARQIPIVEYSPKSVKQSVTGNGNASKEQVAAMVVRLLKITPDNFLMDATDALAIALTHLNQGGKKAESKGGWEQFLKTNTSRIKKN